MKTQKKKILKNKYALCEEFFFELSQILYPLYEIVGALNTYYQKNKSKYLVPFGSDDQISRFLVPTYSFRLSDHWNWKPNIMHYSEEIELTNIQRYCIDMPPERFRGNSDYATKPQYGILVAICDSKGIYHCVFGDKYYRKTHSWGWVENTPKNVINYWLN